MLLQSSQPALHPLFVLQTKSGRIFCLMPVLVGVLPSIQSPIHCLKVRDFSMYVSLVDTITHSLHRLSSVEILSRYPRMSMGPEV